MAIGNGSLRVDGLAPVGSAEREAPSPLCVPAASRKQCSRSSASPRGVARRTPSHITEQSTNIRADAPPFCLTPSVPPGCVAPVADIVEMAQKVGARVLLDACQSVPHMPVDVRALGVDWIVASSHKMCGPTGVGFLWGKMEVLEGMPPWMGGGEMIQDVFLDHSTYALPPARFEAGTPAIAEAIGLGAACDFLSKIGMDRVHAFEEEMSGLLYEQLSAVDGVRIYGPKPGKAGGRASLAAFNVEGLHATDVSVILDQVCPR